MKTVLSYVALAAIVALIGGGLVAYAVMMNRLISAQVGRSSDYLASPLR